MPNGKRQGEGTGGRVYHDVTESTPQLVLAMLIFKEGSWGAYDHKGKAATEKEVKRFFDEVIAICAAESSFNARAVNGVHKGLFQINEELHADKIKGRDLFDPLVNVEVAAAISRESFKAGHDMFRPWEAYTAKTPQYLLNRGWGGDAYDYIMLRQEVSLGQATAKAAAVLVPGGALVNSASSASDTVGNFLDNPAAMIVAFLKGAGATVGVFILALLLIAIGAWILFGKKATGKALKEGVSLLPAGKAGKAIKAVA